jgi:uncharacterized GH25 family protein
VGAGIGVQRAASVEWAFLRSEGSQQNADSGVFGADGWLNFESKQDGVHRVGVDLKPRFEFDPQKRTQLEVHRSAAALIRLGMESAPSPVATAKTGQVAEIRPLMDPTALPVGSDLPFRLYIEGSGAGEATLTAESPSGRTIRTRTDFNGIGALRLEEAGIWILEFRAFGPASSASAVPRAFAGTLSFYFGGTR